MITAIMESLKASSTELASENKSSAYKAALSILNASKCFLKKIFLNVMLNNVSKTIWKTFNSKTYTCHSKPY